MTTRKPKRKEVANLRPGMLATTAVTQSPVGTVLVRLNNKYKYRYTTGPFLLPANSGSLDWTLLNNDTTAQKARVTVFQCPVGAAKIAMPPGALTVSIDPGRSTHNANEYTEGFAYEVQVECDSQLIFPYASVWPGNFGVVIPGTGINSGSWLRLMP